eukprot:1787646-Prymnesium_polylepis.1
MSVMFDSLKESWQSQVIKVLARRSACVRAPSPKRTPSNACMPGCWRAVRCRLLGSPAGWAGRR